mgnify:CR=1 FL=1
MSLINKKVSEIIEKLKTFAVGDSEIELKTMLDYFNTIFSSFDKEKESKDIFRENIKKFNFYLSLNIKNIFILFSFSLKL